MKLYTSYGVIYQCGISFFHSGLNSPSLFKAEGDKKLIHQLVSAYNQGIISILTKFLLCSYYGSWRDCVCIMTCLADPSASIPEGVNPVDVAALMKYYLASLPTPLTTFELYNEIKDARSSVSRMRKSLLKLSNVNYNTLEFITALLLRVSQKSLLNKVGLSYL